MGDPQTLNLYAYGRNNPVTVVDADGHTPLDWIWEQSGYIEQEVGFGFHLWAGAAAGKTERAIAQGPGAIPLVVPGAPSLLAPGSEVTVTAATALDPATLLAVDAVLLRYDVLQFRQLGEAYGWWNAPVVLPPPVLPASKSNPLKGAPGSTSTTYQPDGRPKQVRRYGPDGYPETDVDLDHDHGQGKPHAHDWGRPSNSGRPTSQDRGPGRPVRPGDPWPN